MSQTTNSVPIAINVSYNNTSQKPTIKSRWRNQPQSNSVAAGKLCLLDISKPVSRNLLQDDICINKMLITIYINLIKIFDKLDQIELSQTYIMAAIHCHYCNCYQLISSLLLFK